MLRDRLAEAAGKLSSLLLSRISLLSRIVYRVYEEKLLQEIRGKPLPVHIGIIPDGNRRWATRKGLDRLVGHEYGYQRMRDVVRWIFDLGIKIVTVYVMSTENCIKRPREERDHIFSLLIKGLRELDNEGYLTKNNIRIRIFGKTELWPREVRELARELEIKYGNRGDKVLNIALCYGGRHEIVEAARRIAVDVKNGSIKIDEINEDVFKKYLYTSDLPDPDLVIRTSGEERISNFLLWQTAYSELYFCEAYWPDFRRIDLLRAIRSYQKRERRFGG